MFIFNYSSNRYFYICKEKKDLSVVRLELGTDFRRLNGFIFLLQLQLFKLIHLISLNSPTNKFI